MKRVPISSSFSGDNNKRPLNNTDVKQKNFYDFGGSKYVSFRVGRGLKRTQHGINEAKSNSTLRCH